MWGHHCLDCRVGLSHQRPTQSARWIARREWSGLRNARVRATGILRSLQSTIVPSNAGPGKCQFSYMCVRSWDCQKVGSVYFRRHQFQVNIVLKYVWFFKLFFWRARMDCGQVCLSRGAAWGGHAAWPGSTLKLCPVTGHQTSHLPTFSLQMSHAVTIFPVHTAMRNWQKLLSGGWRIEANKPFNKDLLRVVRVKGVRKWLQHATFGATVPQGQACSHSFWLRGARGGIPLVFPSSSRKLDQHERNSPATNVVSFQPPAGKGGQFRHLHPSSSSFHHCCFHFGTHV